MKKNLLIVDDDEDMCKTLKNIFDARGYNSHIAHDGFSAIKLAVQNHYDIVLIDLIMDRMNGIQFAKKVRKINPSVSVFIMTAYSNEELMKLGYEDDGVRIFIKPLDIENIIQTFEEEMAKKKVCN